MTDEMSTQRSEPEHAVEKVMATVDAWGDHLKGEHFGGKSDAWTTENEQLYDAIYAALGEALPLYWALPATVGPVDEEDRPKRCEPSENGITHAAAIYRVRVAETVSAMTELLGKYGDEAREARSKVHRCRNREALALAEIVRCSNERAANAAATLPVKTGRPAPAPASRPATMDDEATLRNRAELAESEVARLRHELTVATVRVELAERVVMLRIRRADEEFDQATLDRAVMEAVHEWDRVMSESEDVPLPDVPSPELIERLVKQRDFRCSVVLGDLYAQFPELRGRL